MIQPQFKVTLHQLTADAAHADPEEPIRELGLVDENALLVLLGNFIRTGSLESGARIVITTSLGKFNVQADQGRLFLYDARDTSVPYVELPPAGIIRQLTAPRSDAPRDELIALPAPKSPHRIIALAILAAGLALNGYTLYSVFYIDSVNTQPSLILLTEPAEIASTRQDLSGSFSTGRKPGDRGIVINPDGSVRFMEIGREGRDDKTLFLTTVDNGVVEIMNRTTLRYYGDIYHRAD
jgi:hypothetical protein